MEERLAGSETVCRLTQPLKALLPMPVMPSSKVTWVKLVQPAKT